MIKYKVKIIWRDKPEEIINCSDITLSNLMKTMTLTTEDNGFNRIRTIDLNHVTFYDIEEIGDIDMNNSIINIISVRWWDGYLEEFETTESRFGSDLLWMRLVNGKNRHIPLRQVRWFAMSEESHQSDNKSKTTIEKDSLYKEKDNSFENKKSPDFITIGGCEAILANHNLCNNKNSIDSTIYPNKGDMECPFCFTKTMFESEGHGFGSSDSDHEIKKFLKCIKCGATGKIRYVNGNIVEYRMDRE